MKLGIIREGKTPPDSRVPIIPKQTAYIRDNFPIEIKIANSPNRCYTNAEYEKHGFEMADSVADCDVLMGVKEVPIDQLIPNKTYFFFSHTIKKQVYNRKLLQAIIEKNIRLIDYEVLTNAKKKRLIAFGFFAGMVGAHNGVMTYGMRTGEFSLKRLRDCHDYAEALEIYRATELPAMKIVLTGTGRVGQGARKVLEDMGIEYVSPSDFLEKIYFHPVFTVLKSDDYAAPKDGSDFVKKDFYANPTNYKSIFAPYAKAADVMINGIYWDNAAPAFFTKEEMRSADFNIKTIADVTCDIAPVSSIPSTLFASTIADPIFGYDPKTEAATDPFGDGVVDMMTIDNLPNELPRDASESFGKQFIEHILPELLKENSDVLERATVTENGDLGMHFEYLRDYLNGA